MEEKKRRKPHVTDDISEEECQGVEAHYDPELSDFRTRAENAYQEIKSVLRKYGLTLEEDEGAGMEFRDMITDDTLAVSSDLGHFGRWGKDEK